MQESVIIIGGGASGLIAAIFAATNGAKVTVLEQNERCGKKLLSTGNGKCNLTNLTSTEHCFRGTNPDFAMQALSKFSVLDTIRFFSNIGIYTKNKNGYLYPNSEQASSVVDILIQKAQSLKVKLKSNEVVLDIRNSNNMYEVHTNTWTYTCNRLIIACGSNASNIAGSSADGYQFAEKFGHSIIKPLPALVPIKCKGNYFGTWAKVRATASVTLVADNLPLKQEFGEIQFTDYGLSGIPIFQLSRYVSRLVDEKVNVKFVLDFMPDFTLESCLDFLMNRSKTCSYLSINEILTTILPKKLCAVITQNCKDLESLAYALKHFSVDVDHPLSLKHAQISCGGVNTDELYVNTMESKLHKGLHFIGEVVDIDGACGGYNLQWAWTSGALAGTACGIGESCDTD